MDRNLTFSTSGELNSHSARCSATAPHRYRRVHSHNVIMAMQAADIRSDNGGIVGACVINGNGKEAPSPTASANYIVWR